MLAVGPLWSFIVGGVAGLFGLVIVFGAIFGQFRRGVVQELRDALSSAKDEIEIERGRADRLEDAMRVLENRFTALEAENRVLRQTLQSGIKLAPEFQALIQEQLHAHELRSEAMLGKTVSAVEAGTEKALGEFEKRVKQRHEKLADLLPARQGKALRQALD